MSPELITKHKRKFFTLRGKLTAYCLCNFQVVIPDSWQEEIGEVKKCPKCHRLWQIVQDLADRPYMLEK